MWPLILFIAAISVYLIYLNGKNHRSKYKEFYKTPTPPTHIPFLGNTLELLGQKDVLGKVIGLNKNHSQGKNQLIIYIPFRMYVTSSPEECKILLNQAIEKSQVYQHLHILFKNSLLLAPATLWRKNRKITSRAFKQNILDSFVTIFDAKSRILLDKLQTRDKNVDICKLFELYTLDIFCEATVGIESNILKKDDDSFVECVTGIQNILFRRIANIKQTYDFIFCMTADWTQAKHYEKCMHDFISNIIEKKRAHNIADPDHDVYHQQFPVLDLLLKEQSKEKFTDEYIKREMLLFAGAATDTTAYSLAYVFLMLGMHPEIQDKVLEEVHAVIGEDREINASDLPALKYTDMAINEAMRLLPSVPMVARKVLKDIDIGTKVIPANTDILLDFFHMHRDPKIFPDPMTYNPDRFQPEEVAKRHPYSFLPFSGGPRNCIGFKYAKMILILTVAHVVRNFTITTSHKSLEELNFESSVVMTPAEPLDLNFLPRCNY